MKATRSFLRRFSKFSLALSSFLVIVLIPVVFLIFSADLSTQVPRTESVDPLSLMILGRAKMFAFLCLAFAVVSVISSVGLLRRKIWAYWSWVLLLSVGILWFIAVIGSRIYWAVETTGDLRPIYFDISISSVCLAALAFLLYKFLSEVSRNSALNLRSAKRK
jgi:uncharacterized membrane protein YozB (DUF420 family)